MKKLIPVFQPCLGLAVALCLIFISIAGAQSQIDPLPSWNDGAARKAIIEFVGATTDKTSPNYVAPEGRLATFDQDGTIWVEHPIYTQVLFAFNRVLEMPPNHPEWKNMEPFRALISGDKAGIEKFTSKDLEKIFFATHTGMTTGEFQKIAGEWISKARDRRWNRPYTELIYQPMMELMRYLRDNGYKTYIVTGSGQDFVRSYAEQVFDVPMEQVIGSALKTKFTYAKDGKGILVREPELALNDNFSGKPEDIYLFTGRRPMAAFGNSTGDRQMLEYARGNAGKPLMMLVLHDDADREYAYGPANGLPNTGIGTFTQDLYDEAKQNGWIVISMKNDWKVIFPFEKKK